jgi:pyruvate,orthophosphate dikinase
VQTYRFAKNDSAGDASMTALLGGKGANLAEMCKLGLPVPPGFTLTTETCHAFTEALQANDTGFFEALVTEVGSQLAWLEQSLGYRPLVSVRSGAPVSMPGMMDTILNVGLTLGSLPFWCKRIGELATYDSHRRLIQMLATTAFGVPNARFEMILADFKQARGVTDTNDLGIDDRKMLCLRFLDYFEQAVGQKFPGTMEEQLLAAIRAVFASWLSPRAIAYRKLNKIDPKMGTACTVQAMVFGNMGETSGSGVLFTRNPLDGTNEIYGEYLADAQGEDVVAGTTTPLKLELEKTDGNHDALHDWKDQLGELCLALEQHYRDMMDIEFTVQEGQLWVLQCRAGKRSALAAFRIATGLVEEGLIDRDTALSRLTAEQYRLVGRPRVDPAFATPAHLTGIAASPGVATGKPVFSASCAIDCAEPCILITHETAPDDIAGMAAAEGVLTAIGGSTSHAAVVARAMNKPCVVGCTDVDLDPAKWANVHKITIDGGTGRVWTAIEVPVIDASSDPAVTTVVGWALDKSGKAVKDSLRITPPDQDRAWRIHAADWWGEPQTAEQVLDGLAALDDLERVSLDLTPPATYLEPVDRWLDHCTGTDDGSFADLLRLLLLDRKDGLAGLTLIGLGEAPNTWKAAGFRLAGTPATVADLFTMDVVDITPTFIDAVIGGEPALVELAGLLAAGGYKPIPLQPAIPADYAVFTALGE